MSDFFKKQPILAAVLAGLYVFSAVWMLGVRLIGMFVQIGAAESMISTVLFGVIPMIVCFLAARDCRENARTAFCALGAAKLLNTAAYFISSGAGSEQKLLPLIFTISLGAAVFELVAFIMIAVIGRKKRDICIISILSAVFLTIYHGLCLIELYASMQLVGAGDVVVWLRVLASAAKGEFFVGIIRGAVCALTLFLLYEECRRKTTGDKNETLDR